MGTRMGYKKKYNKMKIFTCYHVDTGEERELQEWQLTPKWVITKVRRRRK